jgi:hypothetical protein
MHSRLVRGGPQSAALLACDLPWARFGERELGGTVTDHATSWVRRLATEIGEIYIKSYEYESWGSRLRGGWRHTGPFVRSRAAHEFDALVWYGQNSPFAVQPVAAFERRRLRLVCRATLVTLACPGDRVDALLQRADADGRRRIGSALGRFVTACHERGARDGNLDLRNLLARRDANGDWQFAKLDSPRFRLRRPGRRGDRGTRADWRRLLPQLAVFGVDRDAYP